MEALREFLAPEVLALVMVFVVVIVIIVAVFISNKVGALSSGLEEFRNDIERNFERKINEIGVELPKEIGRGFGHVETQLSVFSDTYRDNFNKVVSDIIKEINDFKNEQIKSDAERHEKLQEKFKEQSLHLQERLHSVSRDNSESFNALQERIRKIMSDGFGESAAGITDRLNALAQDVHASLESMVGMVGTRLNERFDKASQSIENLTDRLNAIDTAQQNIQTLSSDVVNLTRVVADKRARGALGEIQLTHLVGDMLSKDHYELDATLPNGARAPVLLSLPEPTGSVAVSAGLSLDNYANIGETDAGAEDIAAARAAFAGDIAAAVDEAEKLIDPPHTSTGAVLFVPSESAFAEIHLNHRKLVEGAFARHVWIVSPTTMMALLNMARSVIKDVATRQEARRIRDELVRFGEDFKRFTRLVENLAENIGQANKDVLKAQSESQMISDRLVAIGQTADLKMVGTKAEERE